MYLYLTKEFDKLNADVPNIHYGGCCVFADRLYNLLVKLGKNPQIIIMTNYVNHNEAFLNGEETSCEVVHAVIKVDNVLIDNNGRYDITSDILHCGGNRYVCMIVSKEELDKINTTSGWNHRFDRTRIGDIDKAIKKIEKRLRILNKLSIFVS